MHVTGGTRPEGNALLLPERGKGLGHALDLEQHVAQRALVEMLVAHVLEALAERERRHSS